MKNLLFPRQFKVVGRILFFAALLMALLAWLDVFNLRGIAETIVNDAIIIGIALGSLFIVCSKEAVEDEMIRSIRLAALLNALYVYTLLLITGTIFINGPEFFQFMIINLVLFPIIYVVIFSLEMHSFNKMSKDEEQD